MDILGKSVELIRSNHISSTEVADALGKSGVIPNLKPIKPDMYVAGPIHYVYAHDESNWSIHEQIVDVPSNVVLYVDAFNCNEKAIFGDLVCKYLILYKKVKGLVVNGYMRDIPDLKKYNFQIWCKGFTPLGCYNRKVEPTSKTLEEAKKMANKLNGGIAVCDVSGCTVIENKLVTDDTFKKLELIELQEDIWGFCINTLKWSTYDTICLKKYLQQPEVLPEILREKVKSIPFKQ